MAVVLAVRRLDSFVLGPTVVVTTTPRYNESLGVVYLAREYPEEFPELYENLNHVTLSVERVGN